MIKLIVEFQNMNPVENFDLIISDIFQEEKYELRTRKTMSLGGLETLAIAIAGQITATLLLKLVDAISSKVSKSFRISIEDKGETYQLPQDRDKLERLADE